MSVLKMLKMKNIFCRINLNKHNINQAQKLYVR